MSASSDDWQVVEEALSGYGRGVDRLLALDAIARLREREAQLTDPRFLLMPRIEHVAQKQRLADAEARVAELTENGRRMSEQVDELTEGRIQRNARIAELEEALGLFVSTGVEGGYCLLTTDDIAVVAAALAHKEETP